MRFVGRLFFSFLCYPLVLLLFRCFPPANLPATTTVIVVVVVVLVCDPIYSTRGTTWDNFSTWEAEKAVSLRSIPARAPSGGIFCAYRAAFFLTIASPHTHSLACGRRSLTSSLHTHGRFKRPFTPNLRLFCVSVRAQRIAELCVMDGKCTNQWVLLHRPHLPVPDDGASAE